MTEESPMTRLAATDLKKILRFTLDEPRYALALAAVERVVPAVAILPLPQAPPFVLGVINVQGQILAAMDLRGRFGLAPRDLGLDDQFILARTRRRRVALVADSVEGVQELAVGQWVPAGQVPPGAEGLQGLAKVEDDLVLIYDLDQFLSLEEELRLDQALDLESRGGRA